MIPKPRRIRDPKYLEWIRQQPCLLKGLCLGSVEAHHVRVKFQGGIGTKPDDIRAVPLCSSGHRRYHELGRDAFELRYGIDIEQVIKRLNVEYAALNVVPAVERTRRASSLKEIRVQCVCGQVHGIPASKVTRYGSALQYRCVKTSKMESVSVK